MVFLKEVTSLHNCTVEPAFGKFFRDPKKQILIAVGEFTRPNSGYLNECHSPERSK